MTSVMTLEKVAPSATVVPARRPVRDLDAFPHGWRYVRRSVNGEDPWERVPLRRKDVLHPQFGDMKVHNEYHKRFSTYLYYVLAQRLANDPHAVVLHDVGIVWDDAHLEHHAPDIAVIFDVRERQEWSTFNVAQEGTKPALIIEVTSLSNRSTDMADKLDEYEQAGVPLYVIVDTYRYRGKLNRRLLGYQLGSTGRYEVLSPNEKKWLWLEPVHLWLGLDDNKVVCYEASGKPIADYTGVVVERDEARTERDEAKVEAEQAKAKAQAEAEARAAAEAQAQAQAEARAAAEAQAQAFEAELARLRAELAHFRAASSE